MEGSAFKDCFLASLQRSAFNFPAVRVSRHQNVYVCGDRADALYFIESGQVKLQMLSSEGKACLLAIETAGDIFGELCLAQSGPRQETAIAMKETKLRLLPRSSFLQHLTHNSLLEGFARYLVTRVGDNQQAIASLITVDSEHRLAETLLLLAHKLGQPNSNSTRIEHKITHEELAEMVGTTRPRITEFMLKFRGLGLIDVNRDRFLVIQQNALSEYLSRTA
jgi:CRP/FNR family transcriptional regulator, cyclic AMP receptor protein